MNTGSKSKRIFNNGSFNDTLGAKTNTTINKQRGRMFKLSPLGSSNVIRLLFYQVYWDGNTEWSNLPQAKTTWSSAQQTVSTNLYNYNTYA